MMRARITRAALVVTLGVALVVPPAAAGENGGDGDATRKPKEGVDLTVAGTALAGTAVANGQVAYRAAVFNQGTTPASAPAVTVTGGDATTVTAVGPSPGPDAPGWRCAPAAEGQRCDLVDAAGAPAVIAIDAPVELQVLTQVGADPGRRSGITVQVEASGDTASGNDRIELDTRVRDAASPPTNLYSDSSYPPRVGVGQAATGRFRVAVGGPAAASGLTVTGLLPSGIAADGTPTGDGWTCSTGTDNTPTCTLSADLAVGQDAPPLDVPFRPARADTYRWITSVTSTSGGEQITAEQEQLLKVTAPTSDLAVDARIDGSAQARAGDERRLVVDVTNAGVAPDEPVLARLDLPRGVELAGTEGDFECPSGGATGTITCRRTSTAAFGQGARSSLTARLQITDAARAGARPIKVEAFVDSARRVHRKLATRAAPLFVLPPPTPQLTLSWWRVASDGTAAVVTDASRAIPLEGQPFTYELEVANTGAAALATGETIRLSQTFGKDVRVETAGVAPSASASWSCSGGAELDCRLPLSADLAPGSAAPRVRVTLTAGDAAISTRHWPARASGGDDVQSGRLALPVEVAKVDHALFPSLGVDREPTAGGTAALTLSVRNDGAAPAERLRAHVEVGDATFTDTEADGWTCEQAGEGLDCTATAALALGATTLLQLPVEVSRQGVERLDAHATVRARGQEPARSTITTDVRRRLRIRAGASPATVVTGLADQGGPQGVLVLDARRIRGGGTAVEYEWRQLCLTREEVEQQPCDGKVSPAVTWPDGTGGNPPATERVQGAVPAVAESTPLHFRLTVRDGSATGSDVVTVDARPPEGERYEFRREKKRGGNHEKAHENTPAPATDLGDVELASTDRPGPSPRSGSTPTTTAPLPTGGGSGGGGGGGNGPTPPGGITVNPNLYLPEPVQVQPGAAVSITGSATGAAPITYQWSQVSGTNVLTAGVVTNQAQLQFTAPSAAGTIVLELTATDSTNAQGSAQLNVTVGQPSGGTTANAGPNATAAPGAAVTLKGSGTGTAPLSYSWAQTSGPGALTGVTTNQQNLTFTTPAQPTTLGFSLTVTAADGSSAGDAVTVTVSANAPGAVNPLLCKLVQAVGGGGAGPFSFSPASGVTFSLEQVSVSGGQCPTGSPAVTFKGGTASLFNLFDVKNLSGNADSSGLTISSGTLSVPSGWGDLTLTVNPGADGRGLFIPFDTSGTAGPLAGSVTATSLPFIALPSGWTEATTLTFGGAGAQTIALDATATKGNAEVELTGSVGTDGTLTISATADGLVQLGNTSLDVTGTLTKTSTSSGSGYEITGQLNQPAQIASGVTLQTLQATIAGSKVSGNGTLQLGTSSPATLQVALDYTNSEDWSLSVSAATAPWTPVPGLTIPASGLSGSIEAGGGHLRVDVDVSFPGSWNPISPVTVTDLDGKLLVTCPLSGGGSCDPQLTASGTIALAVGGKNPSADLSFNYDIGKSNLDASADFTTDVDLVPDVSLDGVKLTVAYAPDTGVAVTADASFTVLGDDVSADVTISDEGLLVVGSVGSWGPSGGKPLLTGAVAAFSTYATMVTPPGGTAVPVPADGLVLAGSFAIPHWFNTLTGNEGNADATAAATIDPSNDSFDLRVTVSAPDGSWEIAKTGDVTILLESVDFEIDVTSAGVTLSFSGDAQLNLPPGGDVPQTTLDLTLTASFNAGKNTLTGSLTLSDPNGWDNAFGVTGLDIFDAVFQIGVDFDTAIPTPTLGLAAKAALPESLVGVLGIPAGTPITIVADLDLESPCFGLSIGQQGGPTILNIDNRGILTAGYANIQIAPTGCTVGNITYGPGFSLDFDGSVLGTAVDVNATVALAPFSMVANLKIGEFHVGGLQMEGATLNLDIAPASNQFSMSLAATLDIFGNKAGVTANFSEQGGTVTAGFDVMVDSFKLDFVEVTSPTLDITISIPRGQAPSVSIQASGTINILTVTGNVNLDVEVADGKLEKADGTATINAPLDGTTLAGTVTVDYDRTSFAASFNGSVDTSAGTLASASGAITDNATQLTATLNAGSVISATVSGAVAYGDGAKLPNEDGDEVAASKGDFSFSADPVTINLGAFQAQGDIKLGSIGDDQWGDLDASITVTDTAGQDSVDINGDFDGDGSFSIGGTGKVDFVGFDVSLDLTVQSESGREVDVTGGFQAEILGASISFNGEFQRAGGRTTYSLSGQGNVTVDGFSLGSLTFTLSNQSGSAGMSAVVDVRAGSTLNASGFLTVRPPPSGSNAELFYLSASGRLSAAGTGLDGTVTFTDCASSACTASGPTTLSFYGGGTFGTRAQFTISGTVNADGGFSIGANAGYQGGGETDIKVAHFRASGTIDVGLTFSSGSPYVSFSIDESLEVEGQFWFFKWESWKNILSVRIDFSTNPFRAYLNFSFGKLGSFHINL